MYRLTASARPRHARRALRASHGAALKGHVTEDGAHHARDRYARESSRRSSGPTRTCRAAWATRPVLADQKEYNRLAKEYASQGPLAAKAREYVQATDDLAAAKEMLADADMKEFAQEEIAGIEARLPQLEEDIKFHAHPSRSGR